MPTFETAIMQHARALARLQRAAVAQRAALKRTMLEIAHAKKQLRVLVNARDTDRDDFGAKFEESGAASKVYGLPAGGAK